MPTTKRTTKRSPKRTTKRTKAGDRASWKAVITYANRMLQAAGAR